MDCACTAIIKRNDRVRYGATGFFIAKYMTHTYHLCRAASSYSVKSVTRDACIRAFVKAGGEGEGLGDCLGGARELGHLDTLEVS